MDRRSALQWIILLWLVALTIWHFDLSDKQEQLSGQIITFEYDMLDKYQSVSSRVDILNSSLSSSISAMKSKISGVEEKLGSLDKKVTLMNQTLSSATEQLELLKLVVSRDIRDTFKPFSQVEVEDVIGENGELVSSEELEGILAPAISLGPESYFIPYDEDYIVYDESIYRKVMYKTYLLLENRPYYEEFSDCDDFAEVALAALKYNLPGSACFLVLIEYEDISHSMVACVTKDRKVLYFEPQTGEISYTVPQETEVLSIYFLG